MGWYVVGGMERNLTTGKFVIPVYLTYTRSGKKIKWNTHEISKEETGKH